MVATRKDIVSVKAGDRLSIFSSLGSEEKLSFTEISSFLNAIKKFYFGTTITTLLQSESWSFLLLVSLVVKLFVWATFLLMCPSLILASFPGMY